MSGAIPKIFKDGQFLFKDGEESRSIFIIRKGTVSVRKAKESSYVEIAKLYTNEVIGEMSFFDRLPRSASAVADGDVEVLEIPFESLDAIYAKIPDYMKTIMRALADRLRKANEMIRRIQKSQAR